jgi:hypothetical protein
MKRLILCLAGLLVIFASVAVSFINPPPALAATPASYCQGQGFSQGGRNGTDYTDCTDGYGGKQAGKTLAQSCGGLGGSPDQQASPAAICTDAWNAGTAPGTKPPSTGPSPVTPSAAAKKACTASSSPVAGGGAGSINACERGYDGGKAGKSQDQVCNVLAGESKTLGNASECGDGWDLATGAAIPGAGSKGSTPSAAAVNACQGYSAIPSQYNACTDGYAAQIAGTSEDSACSTTAYPHSSDLNACKHGWETAQSDSAGDASKNIGCEAQLTDPLTWIICPVVNALGQVANFIDNMITNQLNVKTSAIFCDSGPNVGTCQAYYAAWQSFRDIALGLMTIAGLIVVISQALGLEILDAYTLRKTLPRLLIAAIAITLSWPLMRFLIQLSDDLGFGVRHLIYAPFSKLSDTIDLSFGGGVVDQFLGFAGTAGGLAVAVPAWLLAGGPVALLSFVGTAALAVLVAIVVLILRQIAIILLMLLSPIAIAAYILPNTQRIFRLWWESFSKALLMFPMIAAFIATGRVFSAIAVNNGQAINQIIGFVAYFAPYFMIPLTFKLAGSSVGALGNFVQSRAQGGFTALGGLRAKQRKDRLERVRGRGLYRKNTGLTGALNKYGHYTLDADEKLPYALGTGTGAGRLLPGRAGKKVGNKLFGRMAAEQAGKKANMYAEHTNKGAEQANLHYSAAWAALGMRRKLAGGMTKDGLSAMDQKYGVDKNGKMVKDSGGKAVTWKPPANGDFHGLVAYGQTLRQGAQDGSHAQYAGQQLGDPGKAGVLSSFGLHMDTQRATLESVAAASAAKGGKLSPEDIGDLRNHMVHAAGGDPAAIAFANTEMAHLEAASQQQRTDIRPAKGIRYDESGEAYSVYSTTKDVVQDGKAMKAFQSKEALDSLLTAKPGAIAAGKVGEYIDETADTYEYHGGQYMDGPPEPILTPNGPALGPDGKPLMRAGKVLTPEAREVRRELTSMAGIYGQSDPGGKAKIDKLMKKMGITDAERQQYMMEGRARDAAAAAAGLPEPPDGGGGPAGP